MKLFQKEIKLRSYPRGYHLITDVIQSQFPEIKLVHQGVLQIFIKHTSAGLTINENADPTVRKDFETFVNELVPESYPRFIHTYEGSDDMPAHLKSSFLGNSLQIPITGGKLNLGTWQGIYLCEFRDFGGARSLVLTAFGV
ncbi:secondary thiamine-phosphate synthase enzyme YjbQ [Belliella kenyensis]|uniref:Secondary thiamine-phosphate synthase enzyme YjbQ n=1 Tax=Belliella kenyensis TaxID=1472724 RepID=A0ABV8EHW2_9BACT|nr:secondary thiamine-phosphate synthase enzyme YjbQ [Belliella kenyensis]MCH7401423.1 secondary thiamine-phosphate synthase enzyme YjbQ [Belliella kenyensis]MDN3602866.1 secondary thiamine-phosphate synthase enzyme YjbQ [Belliella kenyensis]